MTNEPDWMNPANDRKTPYTEEELELFVDDFIEGFGDEWEDLKHQLGESMARQKIKDGFIAKDENNLHNIEPDGEQLDKQLNNLGTPNTFQMAKFTADSGFHSESNLKFMVSTALDSYMADNAFRSRNPFFKESKTYQTEKEKRRLKRSKGKPKQFSRDDFYFDKVTKSCRCPAGKSMWLQSQQIITQGKAYTRFSNFLKHCRVCPLQQ